MQSDYRTIHSNQPKKYIELVPNYIYMYHTDTYIILPQFPDSITDSMSQNFQQSTPLQRTAPIQSYAGSGPRTVRVNLTLHRDMMQQLNWDNETLKSKIPSSVNLSDDYVDVMIKELQQCVLPKYVQQSKMVDPPMVAIRFGNDVFCKGIIQGGLSIEYKLPLLKNDKYALISIAFIVTEVDPYDAESVMQVGSYRGVDTTLDRSMWEVK